MIGKKFSAPILFFFLALLAGAALAVQPPDRAGVGQKEFRLAELNIESEFKGPGALPAQASSRAQADLTALGLTAQAGRIDVRSDRWATLLMAEPMLPGKGVNNNLKWSDLGRPAPGSQAELRAAATQAVRDFIQAAAPELRVDTADLSDPGKVTAYRDGSVIQVHIPRVFEGVPVRGSYLAATINHGNMVLFGTTHWADITTSTVPLLAGIDASEAVQAFIGSHPFSRTWGKPELVLVPVAAGPAPDFTPVGQGYDHRLAWVIRPAFAGDVRRFEALVDAHTGEVLSFEDTNHYAEVRGGVLPVTNDSTVPGGSEEPGWPMPYQDTTLGTTDTGGNVPGTGSFTTTFFGPYVDIFDNCGADSLTGSGIIDWGTSPGTDCTTPGFGGGGNTHASRTGFYELNKMIEMARGQLPTNGWLQQRLTSNMNINNTCNAFWNGTVNFYRSGGGCANTGELAGVFDHEWGHGMDNFDATPGIASPSGEGIADIYTALRLNDSCIGWNFRPGVNCGGNGDPCLDCTGVRDIDYLQKASGQPHDYSWSNATCGGSVHCVGHVYSEAVWSLWKRKLQSAPYNYDNNTAWEIVNRLTFIGAGNTGTWFSGGPPNGGCGANSGYMNYLAADDDNGNLTDGTPHMTAIWEAFNDQEIACGTPTVQDSGCAGVPTTAPAVSTSAGNTQIGLSWTAVAGVSEYEVFRTEGIFGCDFGKVKIAATAGTSHTDTGLQNGRDYSYVVIPKGSADACFGPASACATDSPVGVPDFAVGCNPASLPIAQGGSDSTTCTVGSLFGYTGTVGLACSGNPAGVACSFSPASVSVPADGSVESTLTLDVDLAQAVNTYVFDVTGDDTSVTRTTGLTVQVIPEGSNGPQDAAYDAGLGAPRCTVAGSSCDSQGLLDSRDNILGGGETNQPNTLDACADGTSGSYHSDESNDRIVVSTLDGGNFTEGDTVEIAATVWAWSTGASDALDLYYAADANSPNWQYIASIVPPGGGLHTLTAQYTLPAGSMQAVRAQFRYTGTNAPCSTGAYNDRDDLVFTVETAGGECTVDADCDNGLYCDGAEVCNAGVCEAGAPIVCDDGLFCNGTDTCNEATDSCEAGTPPACDDGQFCNGTETCNEATDSCDAGTPVVCDDGLFCNGTDTCNEDSDSCVAGTPPECDDGQFCNGTETCNEATDSCDAGTPVVCDDGLFCNGTDTCNEDSDSCVAGTPPACNDGQFCNGTETCNEATDNCEAGTPPNTDDGVACTDDSCDETNDAIVNTANDANCDDGAFCNGAETCDAALDCQAGTAPCAPGQVCNETTDICQSPTVHVESVVTGTLNASKGAKYGTATVTLSDNGGNPVGAGFEVTGHFGGSFDETAVATTDSNGVAFFQTTGAQKGVTVTFCVSEVEGSLPYDDADNAPGASCDFVAECGNDILDPGEECDGGLLGEKTCVSLGYEGGTLACYPAGDQAECTFNVSQCTGDICVPTASKEKGPRCSDGLDNDCDFLTDEDDPDCQ